MIDGCAGDLGSAAAQRAAHHDGAAVPPVWHRQTPRLSARGIPGEDAGFSLFGIAGVLKLVGGILLALGLFTRPVAFILSGEMAFAYFLEHAEASFFPFSTMAIGHPLLLHFPLHGRGGRRAVES